MEEEQTQEYLDLSEESNQSEDHWNLDFDVSDVFDSSVLEPIWI